MPTLYEYLGLAVLFYSDEHGSIHVHIEYNELVSVAELTFDEEGNISIVWREKQKESLSLPLRCEKPKHYWKKKSGYCEKMD